MKTSSLKAFAVVVMLASLVVTPAAAGPFEDAVMAYGRGDYTTSMQLFRPLAEQGNTIAQYNVGVMYENGKGVPQDYTEALKWYRLSAARGGAGAKYNLGGMYANGKGVERDYIIAHMWFNLAAAQGVQGAERNRDGIAKQLTAAQLADAEKLAKEWKPDSALRH